MIVTVGTKNGAIVQRGTNVVDSTLIGMQVLGTRNERHRDFKISIF